MERIEIFNILKERIHCENFQNGRQIKNIPEKINVYEGKRYYIVESTFHKSDEEISKRYLMNLLSINIHYKVHNYGRYFIHQHDEYPEKIKVVFKF